MSSPHGPMRSTVTVSLATSRVMGGALGATAETGQARRSGSRTLVAYFSHSGNTRVVAGMIHRTVGTDLFEIRAGRPYPEGYLETVEQASQERDGGYEPALESQCPHLVDYDTVFLGFPIWGDTTPPIIRAFLSAHDLSGKTLVPFITHGGYGLGNSAFILASHAPKARLRPGFSMRADQERPTMERVAGWLAETTNGVIP